MIESSNLNIVFLEKNDIISGGKRKIYETELLRKEL